MSQDYLSARDQTIVIPASMFRSAREVLRYLRQAQALGPALNSTIEVLARQMRAELVAVYRFDPESRQLCCWVNSGPVRLDTAVPLTPASIIGFVASSHEPVCLDEYEPEALAALHPALSQLSGTHASGLSINSLIALPILAGSRLLGVLEVLNPRAEGGSYAIGDQTLHLAQDLAEVLGRQLGRELAGLPSPPPNITVNPYETLVQRGLVAREAMDQLQQVAALSREVSLGKLLMTEARVPAGEIAQCLEDFYGVPFVAYDPEQQLDSELLEVLNRHYLCRALWVPLQRHEGRTVVLIDDPRDRERLAEIQSALGGDSLELRVGLPEDILSFLMPRRTIEVEAKLDRTLDEMVEDLEQVRKAKTGADAANLDLLDESAPAAVKLVNGLILEAIRANASDLHIEPGEEGSNAQIRIRVDGDCMPLLELPSRQIPTILARVKIMANLDIAEKRLPQDGKMTVMMNRQRYELRVATIPTVKGESGVLRVLAVGGALPIEALNLSPANLGACRELVSRPHGLFLVVGPTGSGKTTTLHSLLSYVNRSDMKIWTAEDPVEITQPGLQQVQVMPRIGLTFATALRAFLRADPDVILIGEIRDQETAHAGIEAALTGHLVFSTLHTNSAPETITRLLDMGLDPMNFAEALVAVLAQRLVRRLCPTCKKPYRPPPDELAAIAKLYGEEAFAKLGIDTANLTLYQAAGCPVCLQTGYKGRTGIHELLAASKGLRQLIARQCRIDELQAAATAEGMRSLRQDGLLKVLKGDTDLRQIRAATC